VSMLTGPKIRRLAEGRIGEYGEKIAITPFDPAMIGSNSYDVHLHDTESIQVYDLLGYVHHGRWMTHGILDPRNPPKKKPLDKHNDGISEQNAWLLWPGRVYLASTRQHTVTEGLVPKLDGRSSIARYGLFVHVTAGFGDDGFNGYWTLELVATEPVIVWPGMKIAQISYTTLTGERQKYAGRYQNAGAEPTESRFHLPDRNTPGG